MKNKIIITGLLLIALLTACNSSDNPVDPVAESKLNGTWTENTVQSSDTLVISVTMNENNGTVTGNYNYSIVQVHTFGSTSFTTSSTSTNSDLKGTLSASSLSISFGEFEFDGDLSSDATKINGNAKFIEKYSDGTADTTSYSVTLKKQ